MVSRFARWYEERPLAGDAALAAALLLLLFAVAADLTADTGGAGVDPAFSAALIAAAVGAAIERARIARELHDVIAHSPSVIVVRADGAAAGAEQRPEAAAAALRTIGDMGRDALAQMRRRLGVLRSDQGTGVAPLPGRSSCWRSPAAARTPRSPATSSWPRPPRRPMSGGCSRSSTSATACSSPCSHTRRASCAPAADPLRSHATRYRLGWKRAAPLPPSVP